MTSTDEREYILGTDREELERLRFQHQAWVKQAYVLWERAGLGEGDVVLDLGCGPGFTSFELGHVVGPKGRVIARDESSRFVEFLRKESNRLEYTHIEPSLGTVEELDLPEASLDGAYARWLLCWVEDARAVLERVVRALKPGGFVALQEYLDWGAMKLVPRSEVFDRTIEVCMESWNAGNATIDIGEHIPGLAAECGLEVKLFRPVARSGAPGSLEWRWLTEFFRSYLPRLVDQGLCEADEFDAYLEDWDARAREGASYVCTPTMVDIVLRKR